MAANNPYRERTPRLHSDPIHLPCAALAINDSVRLACAGRGRIAAVLADLDQVLATHQSTDRHGLEPPACAACTKSMQFARAVVAWPCEQRQIAERIRTTLTGGDHHDH